ncbi:MAG: nicotinate-nucleotide adenylyltransferase [Planctomycetota bacterium]
MDTTAKIPLRHDDVKEIGLLGGTFDPVHNGHLHFARSALSVFKLEKVLFIPTNFPPHKNRPGIAPPEDRLAMLRLAISDMAGMEISLVELGRIGRSYTVDTLRTLAPEYPGARFRLLIGADMIEDFHLWREAQAVLHLARPIVAARPGTDLSADTLLRILNPMLHTFADDFVRGLLELPPMDVSSTAIRQAVDRGKPIEDWVPASVGQYIREHGLYKTNQ